MSFDANGKLQEAWSGTVTPFSQIREGFDPEFGQYDLVFTKLEPTVEKNGLYAIAYEAKILAPASMATGPGSTLKRSLYVGTHKDAFAENPETRKNNGTLRFLKSVAKVTQQPVNDQTDKQLCEAILNKPFSNRINPGKPYTDKNGNTKTGWELGRNPSPIGLIPASLDKDSAQASQANGHDPSVASGPAFATE